MQPDAFADLVVHTVKAALGPVLERLAGAEARLAVLGDLRDRVVVVETKAAIQQVPTVLEALAPSVVDIAPVYERIAAAEARLAVLGDLRDRVVAVETKAAIQQLPTTEPTSSVVDMTPVYERLAAAEARQSMLGDLRDRVVMVETKADQPVLPDATVGELQNRVLAIEATQPMTSEKALLMLKAALDPAIVSVTAEIAAIRERLAVAEVKAPVPGPTGTDGVNGKDGVDGMGWDDLSVAHDGERSFTIKMMRGDRVKDVGTFTLPVQIYRGIYTEGRTYEPGDTVTYARSMWHCLKTTVLKPDGLTLDSVTGKPMGGQGKDFWKMVVKGGQDGKDGKDGRDSTVPVVSVGRSA